MTISNNDTFIVSGSEDNTVRIWNLKEKRQEICFEWHTKTVRTAAVTSDSKFIVSGSGDKTIKVWNIEKKMSRNWSAWAFK